MESSEFQVGTKVFGKVMGFPWWPGTIVVCPHTGEWQSGVKVWVDFMNDKAGAWLKPTEVRVFDSYHKQYCLEQNTMQNKHRKYQDKITEAIKMIEATSPKAKSKRQAASKRPKKVSESKNNEVLCISDDDDPETATTLAKATLGKRIKSGKSILTRQHGKRDASREGTDPSLDTAVNENEVEGDNEDGRPRRKRIRSTRYESFAAPQAERKPGRRKSLRVGDNEGANVANGGDKDVSVQKTRRQSTRQSTKGPEEQEVTRKESAKGSKGVVATSPRARMKSTRKLSKSNEDLNIEKPKETTKPKRSSQIPAAGRKATAKMDKRGSNVHITNRESKIEAPEIQTAERSKPQGLQTRKRRRQEDLQSAGPRKSVRSRAVSSSRETSHGDDGTDSEEDPERERKVRTGSAEVAAENLMEHVLGEDRGKGGEEKDPFPDEQGVLGMESVPLASSELVCSILNRVSDLERDVAFLKSNASKEEMATLGEDASAAGLKSAVEALVSACQGFAKVREYHAGVISRSLDLLWDDGHFPLQGADGEILRALVRSLVHACYKRKRDQMEAERWREQQKQKNRQHALPSTAASHEVAKSFEVGQNGRKTDYFNHVAEKSPRRRKESLIDEGFPKRVEKTTSTPRRRRTTVEERNNANEQKLKIRIKVPPNVDSNQLHPNGTGTEAKRDSGLANDHMKLEGDESSGPEIIEEELLGHEDVVEVSPEQGKLRSAQMREGSHESEEVVDEGCGTVAMND